MKMWAFREYFKRIGNFVKPYEKSRSTTKILLRDISPLSFATYSSHCERRIKKLFEDNNLFSSAENKLSVANYNRSSHYLCQKSQNSQNTFGRNKSQGLTSLLTLSSSSNSIKQYCKEYEAVIRFSTLATMDRVSAIRQNFHEECEANINKQINMELYASYVYLSMAYYFERDDVSFPGMHKYFKKASDEEREHAEKLMKYQNKRGGRIVLQPIAKPTKDEWVSPLAAMQDALELEKTVNKTLLNLHSIAAKVEDPQLCDFLESHYLEEQVTAIKELGDFVTTLTRMGPGLGEQLFDKEMLEED